VIPIKRSAAMSQAELQQWMIAEAHRLIEARKQIERPARPVWTNQIFNPESVKVDPERVAIEGAATAVAAKLAQRDQGNDATGW
jgi:hypothetical protein